MATSHKKRLMEINDRAAAELARLKEEHPDHLWLGGLGLRPAPENWPAFAQHWPERFATFDLAQPRFGERSGVSADWRDHIGPRIRERWPLLAREDQIALMLDARDVADKELDEDDL